ncbi:hypothetical protein, partial [Salmonella enterica]|uniref:hypothetical protein n=1 Tax=Salmonella enterica TaxID=28901 RepID=UPI003D2DE9CF
GGKKSSDSEAQPVSQINMRTQSTLYVVTLAALALTSLASAQSKSVKVTAAAPAAAKAGKSITIKVKLDVPNGYHVYGH